MYVTHKGIGFVISLAKEINFVIPGPFPPRAWSSAIARLFHDGKNTNFGLGIQKVSEHGRV